MDFTSEVQQIYTQLLGRQADPKGLKFWTDVAAKADDIDAVRLGIMATDEYRAKLGRSQQLELENLAGYNGYSSSDLALLTAFQNPTAKPEPGFVVDFLGSRMRTSSLWTSARNLDGRVLGLPIPGDYHAETIEWIGLLKSVRSAKGRYVAMELGAGLGPWIVAGAAAARSKQIADIRLCAVEADPQHFALMRQNLTDNGIDPNGHTLLQAAVGVAAGEARWPSFDDSRDDWGSRPIGVKAGTDGGVKDYLGRTFEKTVTVKIVPMIDLVKKEPIWDLVHIDVQGAEVEICRSCIEELNRRVKWIVVGTHSRKLEGDMLELMFAAGWSLENEKPSKFRYSGDAASLEAMTTNDGTQVWRNPALVRRS